MTPQNYGKWTQVYRIMMTPYEEQSLWFPEHLKSTKALDLAGWKQGYVWLHTDGHCINEGRAMDHWHTSNKTPDTNSKKLTRKEAYKTSRALK